MCYVMRTPRHRRNQYGLHFHVTKTLSTQLTCVRAKQRKRLAQQQSVMPIPDIEIEFDLSPITPGLIKRTLQKRSSTSSSGADGITYFHLKNLPSTHHFLATTFTKMLLSSQNGPSSWFQAEIILIPKEDDLSQPSKFRPIALTSTVSKLFHKILAKRLERFVLQNNIINPTLQKGFISGTNGTWNTFSPFVPFLMMPSNMVFLLPCPSST